ncbi:MAG: iron-containing alcohol dehydrogenase [Pseudomonadota bacterium]
MAKLTIQHPVFRHAPAVTFGRGSLRSLGRLHTTDTVYLTSAATAVKTYLAASLSKDGIELDSASILEKPAGEPTADALRIGAAFLEQHKPGRIVAIGGGSVLDWARLVWALASGALDPDSGKFDATAADYRVSFCLAPTTCGTGAEAADVVVYSADDGTKRSVVSPVFMADQVILDGRFLDDIPRSVMASFVCDAISHAVESYLSVVPGGLAKGASVHALNLLLDNFGESPSHSQQDRLMEGSFLAGVAAANCSVGIIHAFAHSIGQDKVPHGLANAAGLDNGIAYNAETRPMAGLLAALGLPDVETLRAKIGAISSVALGSVGDHAALRRLGEAGYQDIVAERMAGDVTIRSNPRRPDGDELVQFVRDVAAQLAAR